MATLTVTKSYTASSAKANVVFKLDYTVTTSDPAKVTVKANKVTVTLTSSGSGEHLAAAKIQRQLALNTGLSVSLKLASTTMFTGLTVNDAGVYTVTGSSTTQDVSKVHSATSKTLTLTAAGVTGTATVNIPTRTSYKVTLNANGGTGGTASLTKWHGETLTLPAPTLSGFTAPTRAGWKFLGYNTDPAATAVLASYAANEPTTLYAVWERQITGITLNVHTLRVDDGVSTAEADDGTWCYGTCDYTVTGAAVGELTLRVSTPSPGVQILQSEYTVTKLVDQVLSGTIVFRASNCSTDSSYVFTVSAECENTSATQAAVTNSASDTLSLAFFTMDFLGDDYLFNLTADASIDYGKTYYQLVDGSYQAIPVSELQQDLLHTYYEKNGPRPGHGIAFGLPCKKEGFAVGLDFFLQQWAGVIQMFGGSTPPAGWLLCDGSAVSRTTYATLFAAIGTTWGAGDGSTTFNLPDLRGRAPIGAGTGSGLTARTLGGKTGAETVKLKSGESGVPAHAHGLNSHTHSLSKHYHKTSNQDGMRVLGYNYGEISTGVGSVRVTAASSGTNYVPRVSNSSVNFSGFTYTDEPYNTNTSGAASGNTANNTAADAANAHNNMQPSAVVNFIIHTGKTD